MLLLEKAGGVLGESKDWAGDTNSNKNAVLVIHNQMQEFLHKIWTKKLFKQQHLQKSGQP